MINLRLITLTSLLVFLLMRESKAQELTNAELVVLDSLHNTTSAELLAYKFVHNNDDGKRKGTKVQDTISLAVYQLKGLTYVFDLRKKKVMKKVGEKASRLMPFVNRNKRRLLKKSKTKLFNKLFRQDNRHMWVNPQRVAYMREFQIGLYRRSKLAEIYSWGSLFRTFYEYDKTHFRVKRNCLKLLRQLLADTAYKINDGYD